ncbi:MAG: CbtA family protein [Devosia sp.]
MKLFQRIFFAAVLSGLAAGGVMAGLQQWRVAPLILAAEVYENAEPAHSHDEGAVDVAPTPGPSPQGGGVQVVPAHEHEHDEDAWAPADGPERVGFTVSADILAALGFAFVLAAASVLGGIDVTARNGVIWGLAGFAVFQLAPAFGLAPELPGMPAADLLARQIWWWGTAIATATAIFGIAKFQNWPAIAIGAVLVLLPHVIGAPQLVGEHESGVPAHLATEFAANTLFVGAAFWMVLGPLYGWLVARFAEQPAGKAVAA